MILRQTGQMAAATNRRPRLVHPLTAVLAAALLGGCDLAPIYQPPAPILPASYHGSAPFTIATPDDRLPRGPWWEMFSDRLLDQLEQSLDANNPTLMSAQEDYVQSRDIVGEARAGLFPQLGAGATLSDNKQSLNRLFRSNRNSPNIQASNEINASASWEPDFWYQIRNEVRSAKAVSQATAADLATARLSLEAELASDYMAVRGLDAEEAVFNQTIASYQTAVSITHMRLAGKISSAMDYQRAQNQLAAAQAADTDVVAQRSLLVHAIAVLAGMTPGTLMIPPVTFNAAQDGAPDVPIGDVPVVPAGVPSALLQRRPDIASAERFMAAANAEIGVARAAFYPNVNISALTGIQDNGFNLFSLPNSLWAVGASAVLPLFEGGLRRAELQQNWSRLAQTSDNYRQTVLVAMQEVEDDLVLARDLATEAQQDRTAVSSALQVQTMSLSLYTGGVIDYIDVTVAQIQALSAEIAAVQVHTRRLQAAVDLVRALGGGWSVADLPTGDQTLPFNPLDPVMRPGDVRSPGR